MKEILASQMFVLFAILAAGYWFGQIKVRGISLGAAGVLFTGLVFGHFGFQVPKALMDLGLLFFVYSVGLQSGPQFFRSFRKSGLQYLSTAAVIAGAGAAATVGLALLLRIPIELACGLYTGALTCTPALAAATDIANHSSPGSGASVSVAYGVAYPFAAIGVVLLIQVLPRLLRREVGEESERWRQEQESELPRLLIKQYSVTNPNCFGLPMKDITRRRMSLAVISRVRKGEQVLPATPDVVLEQGDCVMAVGSREELEKLRLILGEETNVKMDLNADILAMDVEVTESALAGKKLGDLSAWEHYGVVITRVRRQSMELTPTGSVRIEMGDILHAVGARSAVEEFARLVDVDHRKVEETNMLTYLMGLALGVLIGLIPFHLQGGLTVKLGLSGGVLISGILLSFMGRIGPFRLYVPQAAKNLSRELGLVLFLAGAGTTAGSRFVALIREQGWSLLFAGAAVTTLSVFAGILWMHLRYRLNVLAMTGAIAGCMTNSPALGAASSQTKTDLPTLTYASVYPVALILKIILVQILAQFVPRVL